MMQKPDFKIGDWVEWILKTDETSLIQPGMKGVVIEEPTMQLDEFFSFRVKMVGFTPQMLHPYQFPDDGGIFVDEHCVKKIDAGPEDITHCPNCHHMWEEA